MPRRLIYNDVKSFFNDNDYKLLCDKYKNAKTKLKGITVNQTIFHL
jgi:hypothetical protein